MSNAAPKLNADLSHTTPLPNVAGTPQVFAHPKSIFVVNRETAARLGILEKLETASFEISAGILLSSSIIPASTTNQWMTDREVGIRIGIKKSTVWKWVKEKSDFPKPHKISGRCTRWLRSEVEEYVASL